MVINNTSYRIEVENTDQRYTICPNATARKLLARYGEKRIEIFDKDDRIVYSGPLSKDTLDNINHMVGDDPHVPSSWDDVQVGDIFHSSWGYSMSLNSWYQVVSRTKSTITIRKLNKAFIGSVGFLRGMETAVPNSFEDRSNTFDSGRKVTPEGVFWQKTCRVRDRNSVSLKIDNYEFAHPWDGEAEYYDHCD